jgi:hypothetical protein
MYPADGFAQSVVQVPQSMCRRHCRPRLLQPNLWENTVSLLKYAIAAAIGYYAGQPGGRRQIQQLGQKATELVKSPKAAELKDRGRELVGERASAAVDKVRRKTTDDSTSSGATTTTTARRPRAPPRYHPRHHPGTTAVTAAGGADNRGADDIQAGQTGTLPPGPHRAPMAGCDSGSAPV